MLEHPAHVAIVHSVIDLGHNLGLRVVAEPTARRGALTAGRDDRTAVPVTA